MKALKPGWSKEPEIVGSLSVRPQIFAQLSRVMADIGSVSIGPQEINCPAVCIISLDCAFE